MQVSTRRLRTQPPPLAKRNDESCDQWRQSVPPAQAREPYDNEVVKCWTAEITKATDIFKMLTQRDLRYRGLRSVCLTRKWIANCKPIDRLAISHVLRVKCAGTSMYRSP